MSLVPRERILRNAREDFLSGAQPRGVARLRPEIVTSWRRSQLSGVSPHQIDVPFSPLSAGANRSLIAAAAPVIDWLADQIPAGTAVILADAEARILDRRASGNTYSRYLDEVSCVPGSSYREEHIGTNGIGSVIETSSLVVIAGAEHYRENLQDFACVGTPLHHPLRQNLTGVLSVSCNYRDAHDLMIPLLQSATREIESRMYADSSMRERMLLEEFLGASRRTSAAVISLNQDFLMTNTAAARLLDTSDHAMLWEWASASMGQRTEFRTEVPLRSGAVQAKVRMVGERPEGAAGVLIEIRVPGMGSPHRKPAQSVSDPELPGRSPVWRRTLIDVDAAVRTERDVLLIGEAGTGKSRVAARVAGNDAVVFEAALAGVEQDWALQIRHRLDGPDPVIIRHLEALSPSHVALLAALLGSPHTARVVATANTANLGNQTARLLDHFGVRVELPPLRNRPEDIPDIAARLLRSKDSGPPPRIQPTALRTLGRQPWPGNIRELKAALTSARLRALGGDIGESHLPSEYRRATANSLPSLQRSERETILAALNDSHGNKLAAAEQLGIARSTLYRKMRALDIKDQW